MAYIKTHLIDVERNYRIDIMLELRKAVNERFYGLRKAEEYKKEMIAKLDPKHADGGGGFMSKIPFIGSRLERKHEKVEVSTENIPNLR